MNNEDGAAFTSDGSSANTAELVDFHAQNRNDLKAFILGVNAPVTDTLGVSVKYGKADFGAKSTIVAARNKSASEVVLAVSNKLAKNLSAKVTYASYSHVVSAGDTTNLRAELKYTF